MRNNLLSLILTCACRCCDHTPVFLSEIKSLIEDHQVKWAGAEKSGNLVLDIAFMEEKCNIKAETAKASVSLIQMLPSSLSEGLQKYLDA